MSRRHYSKEFKDRAAELVRMTGQSVHAVAMELEVPPGTLWKWVHRADAPSDEQAPARGGRPEAAWVDPVVYRAALERITELERENAFLGKASAFFAKKAHP